MEYETAFPPCLTENYEVTLDLFLLRLISLLKYPFFLFGWLSVIQSHALLSLEA